jgi:hypothetical protein
MWNKVLMASRDITAGYAPPSKVMSRPTVLARLPRDTLALYVELIWITMTRATTNARHPYCSRCRFTRQHQCPPSSGHFALCAATLPVQQRSACSPKVVLSKKVVQKTF